MNQQEKQKRTNNKDLIQFVRLKKLFMKLTNRVKLLNDISYFLFIFEFLQLALWSFKLKSTFLISCEKKDITTGGSTVHAFAFIPKSKYLK